MKSIKKLAKQIELDNKVFNKASKAEKRVIIAKDCILRIKAENFTPIQDCFLHRNMWLEGSIKDIINQNREFPVCNACAKGGLFLSYVGRVNECTFGQKYSNGIEAVGHSKLLEIFSPEQLDLIEIAFEGVSYLDIIPKSSPEYIAATNFNEGFLVREEWCENDEDPLYTDKSIKKLLIAICKNIIENKGTFKP